jgi:hypothetical protein
MQEFTIQSEKQNPDVSTQNVQNTNPVQPVNQNKKINNPLKSKDNSSCLVILIVSALTILLVSLVVILYLHFSNKSSNKDKENEEVLGAITQKEETIPDETTEVPEELKDVIFYTDGFNIFKANKFGREVEQITNFSKTIGLKITNIQLVNEEILGFIKCELENEQMTCKIIKYDYKKKEVLYYKVYDSSVELEKLTWLDPNNYAYSKVNKQNKEIEIYYVNTKEELLIDKIPYSRSRDISFVEDSITLSFSPDNQKLLYINTFSKEGFNFVTYIYSLKGEKVAQIEDSTMPAWTSNNNVIYRKYSNKNSGFLYEFDINTQKSSKLTNTLDLSYNPKILNQKVAFWELQTLGKSYIYNLDKKELYEIKENFAFPIWLNENELIVAKIDKCQKSECKTENSIEFVYQFSLEEFYIYNLSNNKKEVIDIREKYLKNGIVTWYNRSL